MDGIGHSAHYCSVCSRGVHSAQKAAGATNPSCMTRSVFSGVLRTGPPGSSRANHFTYLGMKRTTKTHSRYYDDAPRQITNCLETGNTSEDDGCGGIKETLTLFRACASRCLVLLKWTRQMNAFHQIWWTQVSLDSTRAHLE